MRVSPTQNAPSLAVNPSQNAQSAPNRLADPMLDAAKWRWDHRSVMRQGWHLLGSQVACDNKLEMAIDMLSDILACGLPRPAHRSYSHRHTNSKEYVD